MTSLALLSDTTSISPSAHSSTTDQGQRTTDPAQAARNRANAQKSTGPRTPEGKKRSAQNARTHGLSATTPPTEVAAPDPCARLEYTTALTELREEHRPSTPTQHALVDELALILWKLQYLPRIEHRLLNTPLPDPSPEPDPLHITPHPRLDHDLDPTARILAAHFASDHATPLTRLFAYHNRLQARTNSLLNQLRRLKRDQQTHRDDDDGTTWSRAYNKRNAADHTALMEESRRIHHDNLRKAADARRSTDPPPPSPKGADHAPLAQPPTSPVGEGGGEGRAAQPGATPRNRTAHDDAPAQNEPTSPSVASLVNPPSPAPQSATPRHIPPQNPPPAQNEATDVPPRLAAAGGAEEYIVRHA